jgi:hypothetical protein
MADNSRVEDAALALKQMMDAYLNLTIGDEPADDLKQAIEQIAPDYSVDEVAGFCYLLQEAIEDIDPDAFADDPED